MAAGAPGSPIRPDQRRMGLVDGIALTVGLQIGSGIFSSPGVITLNTGSIGASLVVWLVSGVLAWTGASSFAELGAAIPLNGGAQAYLNYSFGPLSAYLFAWTSIVALKSGSGAIIATIFGEYVARVLFHTTSSAAGDPHEQGLDGIPGWSIKLSACIVVVLISGLQALSSKLGTRAQVATTAVKLAALVAVPILAIVQASRGRTPEPSRQAMRSFSALFEGSSTSPSNYALALYSGLWAFDGWDQSTIIAGEIKNVTRNLPRAIHSSLGIVLAIFMTTVLSYFLVLPPVLVKQTNTVALDFGSAIFGTAGGVVFACLVAFSCLGALNGQFYTSGRFVFTAGKEGYLPKVFGRINTRTRTPIWAIVLQAGLVLLFILFGSGFASLVNFYGVCSWSGYFFTVLGLLVLRIKEPNLERPYRTWLVTPIVFSAVALFLLIMPIFSSPLEAIAAFGFILAGVPMYYLTQKRVLSGLFSRQAERDTSASLASAQQDRSSVDEYRASKEDRTSADDDDEEAMEMLPRNSRHDPER
ncbi:amino acid transporter [Ceraceosorus bombacis]|uniref:Amino acid transporter n=1 Tax=Ceraceosorus bombacis TaxID=401625 RepID=A0A0P1BQ12_9BASI|nr:amino acid transporter [Ceraceosorus bombacis]